MKTVRLYSHVAVRFLCLALVLTLVETAFGSRVVEQKFDVLKTRTATYTNVTVTTLAKNYIFIFYSGGMTSIKVSDLPVSIRQQLGYAVPKALVPRTNEVAVVAARQLKEIHKNLKPVEEKWQAKWKTLEPKINVTPAEKYVLLAVALLFYLFYCYCCSLICWKANKVESPLIWVPVLQIIPLLRAAGMSGWWFLACFVPLLNIVLGIVWSVKIVKARGKNILVAILLLLPITNLLAFLYLAFSSVPSAEPRKYKSMSLQTA